MDFQTPPKSHDTVVIAGVKRTITFFKSYDYATQKDEAQQDLSFVQDKKNGFTFWYISALNDIWKLYSTMHDERDIILSFKLPEHGK